MMSRLQNLGHDLRGATDADMAAAEFVLEAAIDALTCGTFVVANVLGKLEANPPQTPGFRFKYEPTYLSGRLTVSMLEV